MSSSLNPCTFSQDLPTDKILYVAGPDELRTTALHWLLETDSAAKVAGVGALGQAWRARQMTLDRSAALSAEDGAVPGDVRCVQNWCRRAR